MSTWKILVTDGLAEAGQEILKPVAQVVDRKGIGHEELLKEISDYDALIVRGRTKITEAVFQAAPKLKVVGRAGVGVDNIDLAAAQLHNVVVVNSPTSTTKAVAERTLALMLALVSEIRYTDSSMKAGQWMKMEPKKTELSGKTLGIIGVGNIGSAVSRRAAAFGMTIIGCARTTAPDEIRQRGAEPVPLSELYTRSDFISLHVPLTTETRLLIDDKALAHMKRGVYLICTARGGVIDEAALLANLNSGKVAGAALDVFSKEPPGLTPLVAHPNVISTPHIGGNTIEAQERVARDIANEVRAALSNKPLRWRVV